MNADGLNLTVLLISIAAPIAVIDVLYFHIYKFRLASRPESRAETKTHIVRGVVFGVVTLLVTLFEPRGLWFWAIGGLFAFDFVNNGVDAFFERDARAAFGGLPRLEYMIHIFGSTFMGAIALSFLFRGWHLGALGTALVSRHDAVPALMRVNGFAVAGGAFALGAYEALVMAASTRRRSAVTAAESAA